MTNNSIESSPAASTNHPHHAIAPSSSEWTAMPARILAGPLLHNGCDRSRWPVAGRNSPVPLAAFEREVRSEIAPQGRGVQRVPAQAYMTVRTQQIEC